MQVHWPTPELIQQTNQRVQTFINDFHHHLDTLTIDEWKDHFMQLETINPNHTSGEYANNLEKTKSMMYNHIIQSDPHAFSNGM